MHEGSGLTAMKHKVASRQSPEGSGWEGSMGYACALCCHAYANKCSGGEWIM
jgi:hypothetical protein